MDSPEAYPARDNAGGGAGTRTGKVRQLLGSYAETAFEEVIEGNRRGTWTINALTVQVGLSAQIIAERDYTEPLRGSRSGLEHRMKIEIVHCPT